MRFEIVVAPRRPTVDPPVDPRHTFRASPAEGEAREAPGDSVAGLRLVRRPDSRVPPRELLDVFVDGANVTARVHETHGALVLRDLALALADLSLRPRAKRTVRFYDEPWEICVERFGATVCVSVYRTGADPQVAVYDRAVPIDDVVGGIRSAIDDLLASPDAPETGRLELAAAAERLRAIAPTAPDEDARVPEPVPVHVELERDAPLSFGAEFSMRDGPPGADGSSLDQGPLERADLHALLFRGHVRADVRGHVVDLGECHPLLVAERLVELARRAFDAWERGLALHARGDSAGVLVGVRVTAAGEVSLTLGEARKSGAITGGPSNTRAVHTFPALGAPDFLEAALSFGRSLVRAILRHDRAQSNNLRLAPFRRSLREATDALREATQTDSKVNGTPEPYRAFATAVERDRHRPGSPASRALPALPAARLRYLPRWRALVPGLDLRSTYLCGDRMIVGSQHEMWALDRAGGQVIWRTDVIRGSSVVTPGGVARLAPDGSVRVYDLLTGEETMRTRTAPRVGPVAGAVVHLPGLPRLIIVTEGDHHLVAMDLTTGEPQWRWSWRGGRGARGRLAGAPRLKRSGRLVYFTCGDGALTALDVMTGAIVWRLRDRLRFRAPPTVTPDGLFALAGGAHGVARLYSIDPYSGGVRWASSVADATAPCTVEGAPLVATNVVAVAVRQKTGLALATFDRETGRVLAARTRVFAPNGTSWLAVDDAFIGNAPNGELVALDETSGDLRWRQVLGPCPLEPDVPRRLEPILRCGALFVPHAEVTVIRPRDGAVLGTISPTEAIPDLLRVDERCDVFIAEESGHLLAFGAVPRLSLVRG
jgi:outer membrane protein assembly factor BamB